jgi:hypothetical protein
MRARRWLACWPRPAESEVDLVDHDGGFGASFLPSYE